MHNGDEAFVHVGTIHSDFLVMQISEESEADQGIDV